MLTEKVLGGRGDNEGNGVDDVEEVDCLLLAGVELGRGGVLGFGRGISSEFCLE